MIKITNLKIQYEQKIIKELLNIDFPSKGLVGIYGKSGCGKSSLLKILAGVNTHYFGNVYFNDLNLRDSTFEFFKENVTYIPQEYNCFEENTVEENILLSVSDISLLDYFIYRYNLTQLMKQKMCKLSLGEHQRVSLVITFLQKKKINLLDELLCNLDLDTKFLALEDIKKLAEDSLVLLIAHQMDDIRKYCNQVLDLSIENNFSLFSESLEYETKNRNNKLNFLRIKTYGNKVVKVAFIGFILMAIIVTLLALNIATSSYTENYIEKIIMDDPLGLGVNIKKRNTLEEYFDDVEIPFYDISLLCDYYEDNKNYLLNVDGRIPRLFNFIILEEIEIAKEKIHLKDMEVILPDELNDLETTYDEDGSLYHFNEDGYFIPNGNKFLSIVHFTEGNIFNFDYSNLRDIDLVIRKTYHRKDFYNALKEYVEEPQAIKYSELVIMNQRTFILLMTRLLNLQATIKTPVGDKICWICPFELPKGGVIGTLPFLEDGEIFLSPHRDNYFISREELGYLDSSAIITISYKEKEYSSTFNFKNLAGFHSTFPLFTHFPSQIKDRVILYVTYKDFFDILSTIEYDLLEDMKPCNSFINLRCHASEIASDIATTQNKIIFSNLSLIISKESFHTTKQIYYTISISLIVVFFIGFLGYSIYNSKELEQTNRIMRYKMYSLQERVAYIRFKNLFIPILFSLLGILLGLLTIIIGYFLNWDYFYSIQWQPYIIVLVELLFIIFIYFMMEKLKIRKKNDEIS